MQQQVPSVTVVIAARPGQAGVKAVHAALVLDYPADRLEIIVARGRQPSAQRNAAIRAAHGDLIYFLDDDSVPPAANLRIAMAHFTGPEVQMVGGPNLCPPEAPPLEQVFALVLASWLAFGPSRARYARVGKVRESNEKELILCNLVARRSTLLQMGGFNEALYPNEENALMDEVQKRGGRLVYDPACFVYRRPRSSLRAFAKMLMTYGRGRAEQFRLHPTLGSALNFVPPLFCLYLCAVPFLGRPGLIPLALYVLAVLIQAAALGLSGPERQDGNSGPHCGGDALITRLGRAAAAIPLIVLTHLLYGAGFWRGLFTGLKPPGVGPAVEVALETVKGFSTPSTRR